MLELTVAELALINNALNETCNGVHDLDGDSELETRVGASRSAGRELLRQVHAALAACPPT